MQCQPVRPWLGREDSNLRMAESKSAALPLGYAPKRAGPYLRKRDRSIAAIFVSPLVRVTSRSHPATSIAQRRRRLPPWKARRYLPVLSTARKTRFELFGAVPRQKMGKLRRDGIRPRPGSAHCGCEGIAPCAALAPSSQNDIITSRSAVAGAMSIPLAQCACAQASLAKISDRPQ